MLNEKITDSIVELQNECRSQGVVLMLVVDDMKQQSAIAANGSAAVLALAVESFVNTLQEIRSRESPNFQIKHGKYKFSAETPDDLKNIINQMRESGF